MNHPPVAAVATRWRWPGALLNAAVFILALAGGCAAIRAILPFPKVPGVYEKYLHVLTQSGSYDIFFVGSSRFYRAIIPARFEARISAATGKKLKAFNLAFDGMQPPETYYFLREILALRPSRLRWVFLEASPMETRVYDSRPAVRNVYWHDLRHTQLIIQAIWHEPVAVREKWHRAIAHVVLAGTCLTNADSGAQWLRPHFGLENSRKRWRPPREWVGTAGYEELPEASLINVRELSGYLQKVRGSTSRSSLRVPPFWHAELSQLAGEIRAAGAETILLITPTLSRRENYSGYPDDLLLFAFQDPATFPELFDPVHRWDRTHLNREGAKLLTDLIAERFLELLRVPHQLPERSRLHSRGTSDPSKAPR